MCVCNNIGGFLFSHFWSCVPCKFSVLNRYYLCHVKMKTPGLKQEMDLDSGPWTESLWMWAVSVTAWHRLGHTRRLREALMTEWMMSYLWPCSCCPLCLLPLVLHSIYLAKTRLCEERIRKRCSGRGKWSWGQREYIPYLPAGLSVSTKDICKGTPLSLLVSVALSLPGPLQLSSVSLPPGSLSWPENLGQVLFLGSCSLLFLHCPSPDH